MILLYFTEIITFPSPPHSSLLSLLASFFALLFFITTLLPFSSYASSSLPLFLPPPPSPPPPHSQFTPAKRGAVRFKYSFAIAQFFWGFPLFLLQLNTKKKIYISRPPFSPDMSIF